MARAGVPEQLALNGFEPAPTESLFLAIFPDPDVADRVAARARQWRGRHGLTGKPVRPDRLHVTLHPLGLYSGLPVQAVDAAKEAASAVAAAPFEIVFDRVLSFPRRSRNRPFVLGGGDGLAALRGFQQSLVEQIGRVGFPVEPRYIPHMTLLYDEHVVAEEAIEPIVWTAREFVLVHSLVGQTLHVPLARWQLGS